MGDNLTLYPAEKPAKVRGIQVHGESVESAGPGKRCAINISNLTLEDVKRGDVLATSDSMVSSKLIDCELVYVNSMEKNLKNMQRLRLHHGTREILCRVRIFGADEIKPGEKAYVQLLLEEEISSLPGDRAVLRQYSPMLTIAGVKIVNPSAKRVKRNNTAYLEGLKGKLENSNEAVIDNYLKDHSDEYLTEKELKIKSGITMDVINDINSLIVSGKIYALKDLSEAVYIHSEFLDKKI